MPETGFPQCMTLPLALASFAAIVSSQSSSAIFLTTLVTRLFTLPYLKPVIKFKPDPNKTKADHVYTKTNGT
jgi:hypothetical protein